ncbi:MAG: HlyD family secretion protein [Prevotellaceae bacterium]|nr:HlyD family secretion protein [Prevotellaceae bacterium]
MNSKKQIKRIYNVVVIVLLLCVIGYVCSRFIHWGNVEYTDDAQVQRHITPINTRVQGFIKEIRFEEYQHVKKGDTLVIIEDAEYRLQLAQAEANFRGSKSGTSVVSAGINTTESNVKVASASIEEARVNLKNAKDDYERYAALLKKDAVTRQQYDNALAKYEAAKARYDQAAASKTSTSLVKTQQSHQLTQTNENVSVAEASVNLARLNLSYTVIVATADGVMGRKDIHVGQLVQPGEMLARIVDDNQVWVIANYRETQLKHISVGNEVEFTADALPNIKYKGVVQSLSPATGSAYSMVPADNATGNFVKVEQRVPVRIVLTKDNSDADIAKLKAGLNVETLVKY